MDHADSSLALSPPGLDDPQITLPIVIVAHADRRWFLGSSDGTENTENTDNEILLSISFSGSDQTDITELWGKVRAPNKMNYRTQRIEMYCMTLRCVAE